MIEGRELLDLANIEDPNPFYRRLLAEAPVWRAGESDVFLVNSHAMLTEACQRTADLSSNLLYLLYRDERGLPGREQFGDRASQVMATADPPNHALHKKIISPAFSPNRIATLEAKVAELTRARLDAALARGGAIEFMGEVANLVPIEIVSELIGFQGADPMALLEAAFMSTDILAGAISCEELHRRKNFSAETGVWAAGQLQSAMGGGFTGMIAEVGQAVLAGQVDFMGALGMMLTLLAAGGESTTSLVGNAVDILARDEGLQRQLRAQPELIPAFAEEVLRLESPFRHHMRWAPHDTDLGGVPIHTGATVLLMWGAANRDPAAFERPDEVVLDRPRRHVAFGSGIHLCIGNTLARLEARVMLRCLLDATSHFAPDPERPARQVPSLAVRRFEALPLVVQAS